MHIVQIYHSRVPVLHYGGMERVIEALMAGFLELGHKVSLIAFKGDYQIPGVDFYELDRYSSMEEANQRFHELIPADADIVHFHLPKKFPEVKFPYVCTMHGNVGDDEDKSTLHDNIIFLCSDHAKRHGKTKFVFNGLDPKLIPLGKKSLKERETFSFLGRASLKRKGLHSAKKIARYFGKKLVVGGGNGFGWFGCYEFLGQVDNDLKFSMLGESKALLFPIEWEEPFGLVMIEAMFSGTPVFAFNRGSVPEVLGNTPFNLVANNLTELIQKVENYSWNTTPGEIRSYANRHFSHLKMCESYLVYYQQAISQKP